jgi:hypothetical protein
MLRAILSLLLFLAALPAQTVRVENLSSVPYTGWLRATVDQLPSRTTGYAGGVLFVVGDNIGDVWTIDLQVSLQAGERRTIDLSAPTPATWARPPLPADPIGYFGGVVEVGNTRLTITELREDAAAYRVRLRGRSPRLFDVDLYLRWWPGQAWASGEAIVTASYANVPDMTDTAGDFLLRFGDAWVVMPGAGFGKPLVAPGTSFGDGQCRAVPFVLIWTRHLQGASDWASIGAAAELGVVGCGLNERVVFPASYNVRSFVATNLPAAMRQLHSWEAPSLGPAANTAQTGGQEDQGFAARELNLPDGAPAALLRYLVALKTAQHPSHHLETWGSIVDPDLHPHLCFYFSRPHRSCSETLGKPRELLISEASGWNGPDAQHWTVASLVAGARATGSPATQRLLEHAARNYMLQAGITPGTAAAAIWSSREIGWEGFLVRGLDRALGDRRLAERVRLHWRRRLEQVLINQLAAKDIWVEVENDPRLGPGRWWQLWQQALGAYGADWASELIGHPEGRQMALRAALKVVDAGWAFEGGRWVEYEHQSVDGTQRTRSGFFAVEWMPLAVATVLKHQPDHPKAKAVWEQIVQDAEGNARWLPPELLLR